MTCYFKNYILEHDEIFGVDSQCQELQMFISSFHSSRMATYRLNSQFHEPT